MKRVTAAAAVSLLLALMLAASASAAPELGTTTYSSPTHLQPGGEGKIWVKFKNSGPSPVSGAWTLKVTLPPGVTYKRVAPALFGWEVWGGNQPFPPAFCIGTVAGAKTIVCETPTSGPSQFPAYWGNLGYFAGTPFDQVMFEVSIAPGAAAGTFPLKVEATGGGSAKSTEERLVTISETPSDFGVHDLHADTLDPAGGDFTEAGGHPDAYRTYFRTNLDELMGGSIGKANVVASGGGPRTLHVQTPPGFVGDPLAVERCSQADFMASVTGVGGCSHEAQVGFLIVEVPILGLVKEAIYNLAPPHGLAAQLGMRTPAGPVKLNPRVRSDGDFGLTTTVSNISEADVLLSSEVVLWGEPSHPSHDDQRCLVLNSAPRKCVGVAENGFAQPNDVPHPFDGERRAFLSLPTNCVEAQTTTFIFDRWQEPAPEGDLFDPRWHPFSDDSPTPTDCESLEFEPTLDLDPTATRADAPTGLTARLLVPREGDTDPEGRVHAHLKSTVVTLPAGLSLNASAVHGLAACSPEQIGLKSGIGEAPIRFDNQEPDCPPAAKVANARIKTPLLERDLLGEVFVASQDRNPFASTYALYVVVREPSILVKLAGRVDVDPNTGQITSVFDDAPQLPFSEFELDIFGGPRANLATPKTCGSYTSRAAMGPWSAKDPENPTAAELEQSPSSFSIGSSPAGGCAASEARLPFDIGLKAGSSSPLAAGHTSFSVTLGRPDGHQEIDRIELSPPPGLIGSLRGLTYCPESAIAASGARTGKAEQASPSCPPASQIGTTLAGAGAGPSPYYAPGKLYAAGPYKGAPASLVAITPAVAGPFDLGNVVLRTALRIDPRTARVTAETDPLPRLIEGVPLRVREVRVELDRPGWLQNPTNCREMQVDATVAGTGGAVSRSATRFQVGNCRALGFKPRLQLRLFGGTERGQFPALRALVRPRPGDANIGAAKVTLPSSAFLEQGHLSHICTRVQFAADACPPGSVYGQAVAWSPLLDEPLRGPVRLRSSDNKLPDLVADLRGPAHQPVRVELVGSIDSVQVKGGFGIRSTFDIVPDAPVTKFELSMQGGPKGLIVNSDNLCKGAHHALARLKAQNGRRITLRPKVVPAGCKKKKRAAKNEQRR